MDTQQKLEIYKRGTQFLTQLIEWLTMYQQAQISLMERLDELKKRTDRQYYKPTFEGFCAFVSMTHESGSELVHFLKDAELTKFSAKGVLVLRATGFCYTTLLMQKTRLTELFEEYCGVSSARISLRHYGAGA